MENFTSKLAEYLQKASDMALHNDHSFIEPLHVFATMAEDSDGVLTNIARLSGLEAGQLRKAIGEKISSLPKTSDSNEGDIQPSSELMRMVNLAKKQAVSNGDTHTSSDVFVQVCAKHSKPIVALLKQLNVAPKQIDQSIESIRAGEKVASSHDEQNRGALEKYTTDLTAMARDGEIDPVIGRDEEIRSAMQILQRRRKNNPVLIGEPGVGKTAIVEGLAQRVVDAEVPDGLRDRKVLVLDIASMLAGAKYRGEFEERLKKVLQEIAKNRDKYVIFIDELHTLVGAGASAGAVDAANMLKPALARGELRCIGATTLDEYRKHIEKDAALERRFQRLQVQEPDNAAAVSMIRGLADRYMVHHGVRITDPAIVAAVELSARYISDRFLPDKAIDLIDEAAAKLRIERDSKPEQIDRLDRSLAQLKIDEAAVKREKDAGSKQRLKEIQTKIKSIDAELADLTDVWRKEKAHHEAVQQNQEQREEILMRIDNLTREGKYEEASKLTYEDLPRLDALAAELAPYSEAELLPLEVDEDEIAALVARTSGIPVERLLGTEKERLLGMEDNIKARVVNQDQAVNKVCSAVLRSRTGMTDPNRPNGTFLFLGPTGVGKTELAKALASFMFANEKQLIRIDMSEYMERHSVARLIGAPPGYVGYDEGGQLTEAVRRKPYCVVLFDEVEKAHPEVLNLLLQVLDDGRLTDSQGRTVDFRNTVMVMTSNIGAEHMPGIVDQKVRDQVMQEVRQLFRPEFINRLDEVIIFNSLDKKAISQIARLQLEVLRRRLSQEKITFDFDDKAVARVAKIGHDPLYGARPLKRFIQSEIETALAKYMLTGDCGPGMLVKLSGDEQQFLFSFTKPN